jgi:hypothetical protein
MSFVRQTAAAGAGFIAAESKCAVYLALMTALLGPHVTFIQQAACGIWMTAVVLLWDLLLVTLIALPQVQRRLKRLSGGLNPGGRYTAGLRRLGLVALCGVRRMGRQVRSCRPIFLIHSSLRSPTSFSCSSLIPCKTRAFAAKSVF